MWSKMHYPHLKIILLLHIKATPGLDKKKNKKQHIFAKWNVIIN